MSVVVVTRNRPESLLRCLTSLSLLDELVFEILVVDDGGTVPLMDVLETLPSPIVQKLRLLRQPHAGPIVARNAMMRSARTEAVLSLDDDAFVLDKESVCRALDVLNANRDLAAVAFAQASADGTPWPSTMQAAPVSYSCYTAAFIGFAVLLRRRVFLEVGGYQEGYAFYGEEKDFCLRALDAGHRTVYLPEARIGHVPDPAGRSLSKYIRHVIRNDCLFALYNEPFLIMLVTVPLRLQRYFAMRRAGGAPDAGGFGEIVQDLAASFWKTWSQRKPVRWATLRDWRRVARRFPRYEGSEAPRPPVPPCGISLPRLTTAAPSSDAAPCGSTRERRESRLGLSVIIASKDRPESLVRCLRALSLIDDLVVEVLVTDDAGTGQRLEAFHDVPPTLLARIRLTHQSSEGYIVARNRMVKAASSDYVLSLDDDAFLLESTGIRRGLEQLRADRSLAAVAFAQADADGTPWPGAMQPARASYPCYAPAFIGFAALLHRQVFLDLGGFREQYIFYGEEKDYCLRALEAGYQILFLPDARVAHVIDPAGRHPSRYLRHVIRNDCLYALYNEPFPMMLATVPLRLQRYFTMRRAGATPDKGGFGWILRDLAASLPETWRLRNPVRWTTIRKWRRLTRRPPAYRGLETA